MDLEVEHSYMVTFKHKVNVWKALKPGGAVLLTVPCLSPISEYDYTKWGDFWRFTDQSLHRLLLDKFSEEKIALSVYGNYYAVSRFLAGKPAELVRKKKLFSSYDPVYMMIAGASAVK